MKVVQVLNMAQNGYHLAKALRRNGVDCDLVISSGDFGMALPMWEELDVEMDPYDIDFNKLLQRYELPHWIKIWYSSDLRSNPFRIANLFHMTRNYDLLHLHVPSMAWFQFKGKPYVVHESGWVRTIVSGMRPIEKLGRRSYTRADSVIWTNPDTRPLVEAVGYKRADFIPFVIDPDKYKPITIEKNHELLFFHPARQIWDVKGNDKLFRAFARFINHGYQATLRCVDWGYEDDIVAAKQLVKVLKIEKYIEWVPPYSKPNLIKVYNQADAVFDQFILGSGGTACYEAMSCGKPVVIYLNEENRKCFGEMPPVMNGKTVDAIFKTMIHLTQPDIRKKIGQAGRRFTMKHLHPDVIAHSLIQVYMEILC